MRNNKTKNIVALCVAACLIVCTLAVICCSVSANPILGDVNEDGATNAKDVNALKRVFSGHASLNGDAKISADMDYNGVVNAIDANCLSRYVAGSYYPEENPEDTTTPVDPDPVYTEPTLIVNSVTGAKGETVKVTVDIANNPGILAMQLTLNYDASVMTLTGATNGSALSALNLTKPGKFMSPCNFVWDGVELTDSDIKDGTAVTLTFVIAEDAPAGNYGVTITPAVGGVIDNNLNSVDLDIVNGSVTVK